MQHACLAYPCRDHTCALPIEILCERRVEHGSGQGIAINSIEHFHVRGQCSARRIPP